MIYKFSKGSYNISGGSGDGTRQTPWYWYGKTNSTSVDVDNSNTDSSDNGRLYFRVKLTAGTEYMIGQTSPGDGDGKIWLYDQNYGEITYDDDSGSYIDGVDCTDAFSFTPETSGIYIIGAGAYSTSRGAYTVVIYPMPEHEEPPNAQKIYQTSDGFNEFGRAVGHRAATSAGAR